MRVVSIAHTKPERKTWTSTPPRERQPCDYRYDMAMSAKYRRVHRRNRRVYSGVLYSGVGIAAVGGIVGLLLHDVMGLIVAVGSVIMGAWLATTAYYVRKVTDRIFKRFLKRPGRQQKI